MFVLEEGRRWIVLSKRDANRFSIMFFKWEQVEEYIKEEKGVYQIFCVDCTEVPLTGLTLASPSSEGQS